MTINQTSDYQKVLPYIYKIASVDFIEEKNIFIYFPTFLTEPLEYPPGFEIDPAWTNPQYAENLPFDLVTFRLVFTLDSNALKNVYYLDTGIPEYVFGRAFVGIGNTIGTFKIRLAQKLTFKDNYLFSGEVFPLSNAPRNILIDSISLQFPSLLSGSLKIIKYATALTGMP